MTVTLEEVAISAPEGFFTQPVIAAQFGARNGYLLELVDTRSPVRVLQTFVFPIAPQAYDLSEPQVATITPTEGNTIVAEEYGTITRDITISGTFGITAKRVNGYEGAVNAGNDISGSQHFSILRALFRTYSERKKNPNDAQYTELRFHALREDDHFVVVPRSFAQPRNAGQNRVHYEYKIQLTVVGNADEGTARTVSDDIGQFFDDAAQAVSRAFNDAIAAVNQINRAVNTIKRYVANIQAVVTGAAGFLSAVGNALRSLSGLIEYPIKLLATVTEQVARAADDLADAVIDSTIGTLGEAVRDLRRLERACNLIGSFPQRFADKAVNAYLDAFAGERLLTQRDIEDRTAGADAGSRQRVAYGTEGLAGVDFRRYTSTSTETVDATTTLRGLASRYDVPPELIVTLNDLREPYFAEGGGPGVLAPGDTVLIPTIGGRGSAALSPVNGGYLPPDVLLYGNDLAIDGDYFRTSGRFDIVVDTLHGGFDAALVAGVPNVIQGTRISIETERGTTAYIPDLGIRRTAGVPGTQNSVLLASVYLREALLFDPRIESVTQQIVRLDADTLGQDITAQLVGTRSRVSFTRPFGRASGGS